MDARILIILVVVSLQAATGLVQAAEPADSFISLYGDELKRVLATPTVDDDLALAARLFRTARRGEAAPELLTPLCEKAYELAVKDPAGYPTAVSAMRLLAAKVPTKKVQALQWLLSVQQRQYAAARGEDRAKAADAAIATYREIAHAQEAAGDSDGAATTLRQALAFATNARSDAKAAIQTQLNELVARRQTAKQLAALKAKFDANPADVAARKELLRFQLVEMDDPVEAAKLVDETLDPATRKYVSAAAKGIEAAPELACPELGDWYHGLSAQAAATAGKAAVLLRAKGYYNRFLTLHPIADPARVAVIQALQKVDADLAVLGPVAKASKTRRLLIVTIAKGVVHESTTAAAKAFVEAGRTSHAFDATVSQDPSIFNNTFLSQFDAICLLNATGDFCPDDASRQALLDFVRGGKGLVAIHGATSANIKWPGYADMLGAGFVGSPFKQFAVRIEDPASPLNASFGGKGFESADELYEFKTPYSRDLVHVLLSVDAVGSSAPLARRIERGGVDYPISWIRTYGQGRVFCTGLGHSDTIFSNPAIFNHMLAGIRFALGDLQADTTPSAKLAPRPPRGAPPGP
ncbi:MAG: ThuA domain-containing protein [Planctomycetota bacterium]|nr:ThuA domain-containing protein [Planctomycetota bacterium]